jgi:hypothetical protein
MAGKWARVPGAGNERRARLTLDQSAAPAPVEISETGEALTVGAVPGVVAGVGKAELARGPGMPAALDAMAADKAFGQWLQANVDGQQLGWVSPYAEKLAEASRIDRLGYTFLLGAAQMKARRPAQACVVNGQLFVFGYTDAQAQRAKLQPGELRTAGVVTRALPMVPEVKIDALVLDRGNVLDAGKDIRGKVTLRLSRAVPAQRVAILVESMHGWAGVPLDGMVGLDAATFTFSAPLRGGDGGGVAAARVAETNPVPVFFSVGRMGDAGKPMMRVSDTAGVLMDVVGG